MPIRGRASARRLGVVVAFVAAGSVGASACSGNGAAPAESSVPPATQTVAPPSPTKPAVDPAVRERLAQAVKDYQRVYSSIYLDPRQDLAVVATVASGEEADSLRSQAKQLDDKQVTTTGTVSVERVTVTSVTPSPTDGGPTTAQVTTCNDVSQVQGTVPDGTSVVDPKRLDRTQAMLRLQNTTPSDPAGWRVTQVRTGPTIPCDPI